MRTLGDRLRFARERKELTQVDVSKLTGINNKTISNYENSISYPDPETLKILADLYDVSADYLLGRNEKKNKEVYYSIDVSDLPDETIKQVEEYVEFMRQKYVSKKEKDKRR